MPKPTWRHPPPCQVGDTVEDIDTPALVVDLDKLEKNLRFMAEYMEAFPDVLWRTHSKAHKCPALAKLQVSVVTSVRPWLSYK